MILTPGFSSSTAGEGAIAQRGGDPGLAENRAQHAVRGARPSAQITTR